MKYIKILVLATLCVFSCNCSLKAANNPGSDSSEVRKITVEFFNWYIKAIKEKQYTEFQPAFAQNQNGMTSLDFTGYFNNLLKYNFSDSLIIKERQSYEACIESLQHVKYADFQTKFADPADLKKAGCGFNNYYRWIGGEQNVDGIRILNIQFIGRNLALITIDYYNFDTVKNKYFYWENNIVVLRREGEYWKIDNIQMKQ